MKNINIIILSFTVLISLGCSSKVPSGYKELAAKMYSEQIQKPISEFTDSDYSYSFSDFERFCKWYLADLPCKFEYTPCLELAYNKAKDMVLIYAPTIKDSITFIQVTFFISLQNYFKRLYFDEKLLKGATFEDYLFAYIDYMPLYASINYKQNDSTISTKRSTASTLVNLLEFELSKPFEYGELGPGQKAFASIRKDILGSKFYKTLSEKQKLYMEENSLLFLQSLNEKQSALYREFSKMLDYLE